MLATMKPQRNLAPQQRWTVGRWKDPRKAIKERLGELRDAAGKPRTLYWLANELQRKKIMHAQTFYTYMRGNKDTKADTLFEIFSLLGLEIADPEEKSHK